MSGHSDLGISISSEHLPFLIGYKQILRPLLVHRNLAIWRWYPWLLLLSFEMLMILVRWILRKTLNRLLQCHLGVQLDLLYFCCFVTKSAFFKWHMSINGANWTFATDVLASSIASFLLLTFVRFHAEMFSNIPNSLSTAAFAARNFYCLRHRNKFVNKIIML